MENKLIGLVLIVLLVGLGGGFGLGYVIYQPQVQSLQKSVSNLDNEFSNLNSSVTETQSSIAVSNAGLNSISSALMDIQSSVASLQNQLSSLNSETAKLNSTLGNVESSITSLQSQVAYLTSQITKINATVQEIENRTWHVVQYVQGSSNTTSGTFQLKGKEYRVMFTAQGSSPTSWLSIALRFSNGTLYSYCGSSGIFTATNIEEGLVQSGQYYLDIASYQTDFTVTLWDYY
jgi:prefoldin subunit 5